MVGEPQSRLPPPSSAPQRASPAKGPKIEPGLSTRTCEHPVCLLKSFICIAMGHNAATRITQPAAPIADSKKGWNFQELEQYNQHHKF